MNLYAVAIYAEQVETKNFYLGVHFAIALDEDTAREAAIEYCKQDRPDFGFIVAQVVVAPIENDMLPKVQEKMKWLNFVDIAKGQ